MTWKTSKTVWKRSTVPPVPRSSLLLSVDGTKFISEKDKILERWAAHFYSVLNWLSSINDKAIVWLQRVTWCRSNPGWWLRLLSVDYPAAKHPYLTLPEIYKEGGPAQAGKLLTLIQLIWVKEQLPRDFKDTSIIHIHKWKWNRQVCDNHRRILLLSILGKILAKVLLNRPNNHLEQELLPESQCCFPNESGSWHGVYCKTAARKCWKQNTYLHSIFVNLTKAFDTVSRDGFSRIMAKYDNPEKFVTFIKQFHDGMHARV